MRGLKFCEVCRGQADSGRIPCGMRGLKFSEKLYEDERHDSRIPCGMRGLKS